MGVLLTGDVQCSHTGRLALVPATVLLFPAACNTMFFGQGAASLLLVADIVARTLTLGWVGTLTGLQIPDTAGLPVGAVTALLGAPFFLYLLLRRHP